MGKEPLNLQIQSELVATAAAIRVFSPASIMSILGPIPTGIFIIPVDIASYPHSCVSIDTINSDNIKILGICKSDRNLK